VHEEEYDEVPEEEYDEVPEVEYDEVEYIALEMVAICFKKAWHIIKKKEIKREEKTFLKRLKISSFNFDYIQ
jgi:hypothetical protein